MALYRIENNKAVRWSGGRINGISHPLTIEKLWSDADLEAIGLYRPLEADPIPDGYRSLGESVEIVDGVPKVVHSLADNTQFWRAETVVSRFQFTEALRDAGQLQTFIDAARAVSGKDRRAFEQVTEVRRNAKFIEAVRQQVGASQEAVDNLFKAAQAIEE